jgi:hypothetical protein
MRQLLAALHDVGLSHLSPLIAELAEQFSRQPIIGFFLRSKARRASANARQLGNAPTSTPNLRAGVTIRSV